MRQRTSASGVGFATREFVRAHGSSDELKISHSGRTNRRRKRLGVARTERAGAYSYAFLVVGCLLYFRFFLRPLVSTPLASHNPAERKTRCETRNCAREIPSRQRIPPLSLSSFAKLSHTSSFFFVDSMSRFVSSKGNFFPSTLVVYLLLENSSAWEGRRRHVNRFWRRWFWRRRGDVLRFTRGKSWKVVWIGVIYLLYWNYLINGWKKVKIYC